MSMFPHVLAGAWLGRQRVITWGAAFLTGQLVIFLVLVAGTHGLIVKLDKPTTTDFISFYAAGELAASGRPELAYDEAAHYAAEQASTEAGVGYQFFFYPPTFLLLARPLARLPYLTAFVAFEALSLAFYLAVMGRILDQRGWQWVLPVLAFPSVFWTLGLGQNSFLSAALLGAATLSLERRPVLSGICFGALCYKPHFGLLVPLVLAAEGRWRIFASAAACVAGLVALSVAEFGVVTWQGYFAAFSRSWAVYQSGWLDLSAFVTPFGSALLAGLSPRLSYSLQVAAAVITGAVVSWIWWQRASLPVRASALAAGTLLAVPIALAYDMMFLTIAIAWLVHAGRRTGFLHGEKIVPCLSGCHPHPLDIVSAYGCPGP
jgi:alpha-1,2-mannosyltransferase